MDEQTKMCAACKQNLPLSEFNKNRAAKDGHHVYCKSCRRSKRNNRITRAQAQVSFRVFAAREKGLDVSGLVEHRRELVNIIANGSSIMSGIPFDNMGEQTWNSASIDQKVAGKGYPWENIRVVLQAENMGMSNWGKERTMHIWAHVMLKEAYKRNDPALVEHVLAVVKAFEVKEDAACPSSSTNA